MHARSSAQRTNNSNKRLQNKLKEATIRLEKLEKLVDTESSTGKLKPQRDGLAKTHDRSKLRYEAELEKIKKEHRLEIQQLMDEKSVMYKDSITSLKLQHQKDIVDLKAMHMEKMVEIKEEDAKNQELYLQQRAPSYEATIGRQHEYIEKLHSEKEALNKSVSELRHSVNSLQALRSMEAQSVLNARLHRHCHAKGHIRILKPTKERRTAETPAELKHRWKEISMLHPQGI